MPLSTFKDAAHIASGEDTTNDSTFSLALDVFVSSFLGSRQVRSSPLDYTEHHD